MEWKNLLENCCPRCGKHLHQTMVRGDGKTIGCGCGMIIKKDRYDDIIKDRVYHENSDT